MESRDSIQSGRRNFIKNVSAATALFLTGKLSPLSARDVFESKSKVVLRFVVASDLHYGQPGTQFEEVTKKLIEQINHFQEDNPIAFCVLNGDLIHNEKSYLPQVKEQINLLKSRYFATRGNHDMVDENFWKEVWGHPFNYQWEFNDYAIILGDSSNEKGDYLSPNLQWLDQQFEKFQTKKQVFLFIHIPQIKFTNNCIETPAFLETIKKYPNLKAVFHGHDHDLDSVFQHEKIPFIFDAHAGGNWGTPYKGFRVVELLKDGTIITYMMNPTEKIKIHTL